MFKVNYAARTVERGDGVIGAIDDRDSVWVEYCAWLTQGNTPQVVSLLPSREPLSVSPAQARIALAQAGMLAAVEDAVAQMPTSSPSRIAWEYALEFREDSPVLIQMCADLGFAPVQIAALFEAAREVRI